MGFFFVETKTKYPVKKKNVWVFFCADYFGTDTNFPPDKKAKRNKTPAPAGAPEATDTERGTKKYAGQATAHPRKATEEAVAAAREGTEGTGRSGGDGGVGAGRTRGRGKKKQLSSAVRADPGFPPASAGGRARETTSIVVLVGFQAQKYRLFASSGFTGD